LHQKKGGREGGKIWVTKNNGIGGKTIKKKKQGVNPLSQGNQKALYEGLTREKEKWGLK